jgi:transcription elongation factor GreA
MPFLLLHKLVSTAKKNIDILIAINYNSLAIHIFYFINYYTFKGDFIMARQVTKAEHERMTKKLAYLKKEGREEIAAKLQEARSHGDLSENAEYDEARNDQAKLEEEIAQLEKDLDSIEIIEDDSFEHGVVHIGSTVEIEDQGEILKCIIGSTSDDQTVIVISDDSPVGKAIIGKKPGEEFNVLLPSGETATMKVISTEYKRG